MGIYYTSKEGGEIKSLPIRISGKKVLKHICVLKSLYGNRRKSFTNYFSLLGIRKIHSVFFCEGKMVKMIWDSALNEYRAKDFTKDLYIPDSVYSD